MRPGGADGWCGSGTPGAGAIGEGWPGNGRDSFRDGRGSGMKVPILRDRRGCFKGLCVGALLLFTCGCVNNALAIGVSPGLIGLTGDLRPETGIAVCFGGAEHKPGPGDSGLWGAVDGIFGVDFSLGMMRLYLEHWRGQGNWARGGWVAGSGWYRFWEDGNESSDVVVFAGVLGALGRRRGFALQAELSLMLGLSGSTYLYPSLVVRHAW